jgi:hypothetical protein
VLYLDEGGEGRLMAQLMRPQAKQRRQFPQQLAAVSDPVEVCDPN